jgi:hypothetical protein
MADVDVKEVKMDGIEVFETHRGLWVGLFLASLALVVFAFRAATGDFLESLPFLGLSIGVLLVGRECVRLWKRVNELEASQPDQT